MDEPLKEPPKTRDQEYDDFVRLLAISDESIRRFVRVLLPTRDGVDDVVQEAALECWKKFSGFHPSSTESESDEFVRWACVIARFKALAWQRDRSRDRLVFRDSVIEALSKSALESLDQGEKERGAIESCLSKLAEDQRKLVLSVHSPGESVARIAKESGIRARRLYSRINVLRSQLVECVSRQLAAESSDG